MAALDEQWTSVDINFSTLEPSDTSRTAVTYEDVTSIDVTVNGILV